MIVAPNAVAAFVQYSMMVRAQQHEVIDTRLAAFDPVVHVVRPTNRVRWQPGNVQCRDREPTARRTGVDTMRCLRLDASGVPRSSSVTTTTLHRRRGASLSRAVRRSPRPSTEGCFVDMHDDLILIGRRG